jgi:Zn-finger nucleic acid-binding protein
MDERSLDDALVEVCPSCKGLWIDWFDGDLVHVAKQAAPLSVPPLAAVPTGNPSCADCRCKMVFEHYATGPGLWRCGACAGTFVPRSSFEALVDLASPVAKEQRTALQRLVDVVAKLLDSALP